eukprot:364632-Chlamydomonas_euryale.AAC.3
MQSQASVDVWLTDTHRTRGRLATSWRKLCARFVPPIRGTWVGAVWTRLGVGHPERSHSDLRANSQPPFTLGALS